MEAVDVVLLTFNSDRKLRDCIDSIYQNVPVHKLIVVDGCSKDHTPAILADFQERYGNVQIITDRGTRATARQKGIAEVTTDWFLFVDSDVVLCRDWYKKAQQCIADDVGALWGTEVWSTIQRPAILKYFLLITRKIFELRGGTHDTLIRTKAVKGIQIPPNLHVFEDTYIKEYIAKRGYRVIPCYSPFCVHYRPEYVWTFKGSLAILLESVRLGNIRILLQLTAAYGFYTVYAFYQMLSNKLM